VSIIGVDVGKAREYIIRGQLVAIPTETVYGLAGNAFNKEAVLSIFEVKQRPSFDPLIVHTDSLHSVAKFVESVPEAARALADAFWPGPLTLLLPKKVLIPDLVTSGLDTVAVRVPNHPLTLELLRSLDFPLAAPSANPFGYISPTTPQHVVQQLGEKIPYVLDGGACFIGIESTIVGFTGGVPTVMRLGGLSVEDIESVIGKVGSTLYSSSNPMAPGMLKSHYAPRKPLFLFEREELRSKIAKQNHGVLYFDTESLAETTRTLSKTGDLREAAQHLFCYLRELDAMPVEEIWAEIVPDIDLGRAINDRLRRAAAPVH
jgi:L-threonylcarbamoyladenylate synthase